MLITYIPLLICITPIARTHDRDILAQTAWVRGYDVMTGHGPGCSVDILSGAEDLTGPWIWTYDSSRAMTSERAHDLITAWEARLL
jgi:hypothetical protein